MIWMNPRNVSLAGQPLPRVVSIAASRRAEGVVAEYGQAGPFVQFVDVPRQRVSLTIERIITEDEPMDLRPADLGTLAFESARSLSEGEGRRVSCIVVLAAVEHTLSTKRGMVQTIEAIAISSNGSADPITETRLDGQGGA
jgi:hypothetical protein